MKSCVIWTSVLVGLMTAGATAGEYDFFERARYPGPVKKPGVDLYEVEQDGGPHAEGYQRRVVDWWPRKGVDIIEVKDAMPLRTWTRRERKMNPDAVGKHLILGIEELTRRPRWGQPRQFKAHLIGFRGIANRYGNPFEPAGFFSPAAVLRLEDGTKRCFTRGTFIEEDEKYLLELYLEEMDRIRAALPKVEYKLGEGIERGWPNNAKPGEPGTMRVESEHFVWVSGSQHAPNEGYSPWVNRDAPEKARLYREGSVTFAEDMRAYQEYAGVLMPYWDRKEQYKHAITVCGTYRDGHKWLGGYAGGGYGACGVKYAGGGPWGLVMGHEWGHGLPLQTRVDGGGGEILADACQAINDPGVATFYNNVKRPWRNCVHGSYGTGLFYAIMGDDPNWGYTMAIALPVGRSETSIFHTLARVGEQRGLFENGVRGVGDMVGEFSARLAEFDCELRESLRRDYISVKRNYLEAVDRKAGLYRIPWGESPEAFGANIIRLLPEAGVGKISVDFRGFYDPATYGDWRACIVVAGAGGKVRYSPLWNKGVMEIAIKPTDRRFWLAVAATPSALPPTSGGGVGWLLNGRHAYRYPYEVKLTSCRPGTPHNLPGDVEDYSLTCLGGFRDRLGGGVCVIPHPGDTPEAVILGKAVPPMREKVDKVKEATERFVADDRIDTKHWRYLRRFVPHLSFLDNYVNWMLDGIKGRRHPNGGGWVSASAEVAPTAYVAPDAMVLYGARVLDHASIEDYAVVKGPKTVVSGHARVSGQAYVAGNVKIGGYTRVVHPIMADGKQVVPNEVPLRPFQEKDDGEKLWANYAMDREEVEVLEDWFRYDGNASASGWFYVLNLNGHLYGKPKFAVDGERRGFAFDGKTQYGETSPILADLGQITVDIALKWEGGANQAIFDFGTSEDNRFVLTPAGSSGKVELAITRAGQTHRIAADAVLPKGKWAQCRVEIDGKEIAVWVDGRKAAQKASAFRPADVFPPGGEKRNFIAATREASCHFKGSIDYLRVYCTVYDDFTKAPPPRRHASRRVTREFIDTCRKKYEGTNERRERLIREKIKPLYAYYEELGKRKEELLKEIESGSSQATAQERRKLDEIRRELDKRTNELRAEFDKRKTLDGTQRPDLQVTIDKHTAELRRRVAQAEMALREAQTKYIAKFKPEHDWLTSLSWLIFSGHYNYPYRRYFHKKIATTIGGKACHENFGSLESLLTMQTKAKWHTTCDWEWRLKQELDGSIADLPLLRKWLERVRGEIRK